MKKFFCCMATGSFLGVMALLVLNSIKEINVEFSWLFIIAFLIIFSLSLVYLVCKDSYKTKEKLKLLNMMTFGVEEKKDFVEIKKIKVNREECDWYKIYCNTLIEI